MRNSYIAQKSLHPIDTEREQYAVEVSSVPGFTLKNRRSSAGLLLMLLYLMGFFGTFLAVYSVYDLPFRFRTYLLYCAGFAALAGAAQIPRSATVLDFSILGGGLITAFLLLRRRLLIGAQVFYNILYAKAQRTDIEYFRIPEEADPVNCLWITVMVVIFIYALLLAHETIHRPRATLPLLMTFLLIEPGLFQGMPMRPIAAALLIAYWCGMLAVGLIMATARRRDGRNQPLRHAAASSGMAAALIALAVYLGVLLGGSLTGYARSEQDKKRRLEMMDTISELNTDNLEDTLHKLKSMLGIYDDDYTVHLGTKTEQEYDNGTDLAVTFEGVPVGPVYLKGFTGSIYEENRWTVQPKNTGAVNEDTVYSVISHFDCAPQNFPFLFNRSMMPESAYFTLSIRTNVRTARIFQPYASFSETAYYANDSVVGVEGDSSRWVLSAPQTNLTAFLSSVPLENYSYNAPDDPKASVLEFLEELDGARETYSINARFGSYNASADPASIRGKVIPAMLLESLAYRAYAHDAYTRLPEENKALDGVFEGLPESLRNLEVIPGDPASEAAALEEIRLYMAQRTQYTTAPGKTPKTRDFVDFFLNENQKGYCTHYASAGVLIARYLGIPARYCEGYVIEPEAIETQARSGRPFRVDVPDSNAHAWCEYYVDGYGWIPYEMTPGYYNESVSAEYDPQTQQTVPPPPQTTVITQTVTEPVTVTTMTQTQAQVQTQASAVPPPEPENRVQRRMPGWLKWGAAAVLLLLLWFGLRIVYLRRRYVMMRDVAHPERSIRVSYRYLLRLLEPMCGLPEPANLLAYRDLATQKLVTEKLPTQAVQSVIPLLLAAEYGRKKPGERAIARSADAVQALAQEICRKKSPIMRFCMRFLQWKL